MSVRSLPWALVAPLLLVGCPAGPSQTSGAKASFEGPSKPGESTAVDRESVGITIYNQNFGLVREIRRVKLPVGKVELAYRDVSAHIQPETVHIRSLTDPGALAVVEQNYRYDLLSPQKLLEKYVGKKVILHRYNRLLGKDEDFDAEVLSTEGGSPVFNVGGEITYGFPGRVSFPEVPKNLVAKPTLVWLLGSGVAEQKVEVTYLTSNMGWRSDYVLLIDAEDKLGDLQGWVTLTNQSGASWENAKLKLVAGDVQKIAPPMTETTTIVDELDEDKEIAEEAPKFVEEGFFEYHLYTLDQPTSVKDKEQKQVSLLEAKGIKLDKKLIFRGDGYEFRNDYGLQENQKVAVYLDIENKEANKLGMPLPKGTVRVYKADKSGSPQFIGEDFIDHTPRDEKVRVKMGEAFDVVADKKQTDWKPMGYCLSESAWEIKVRNHKDTDETVRIEEPAGGDWTILQSSHNPTKDDQQTFFFEVMVPKKGETKVTYRVRVRWC